MDGILDATLGTFAVQSNTSILFFTSHNGFDTAIWFTSNEIRKANSVPFIYFSLFPPAPWLHTR